MLAEDRSGFSNYKRSKKMMVGAVGIEPTTFGLKGRCSTTELRPYMRLNILHGNKFSDLGGIGARGGIFGGATSAVSQVATIRKGSEAAEGPIRLQNWPRLQSTRESRQAGACDDPRFVLASPKDGIH
jgi:hypothetical protein